VELPPVRIDQFPKGVVVAHAAWLSVSSLALLTTPLAAARDGSFHCRSPWCLDEETRKPEDTEDISR
jgi:hypothetical protein